MDMNELEAQTMTEFDPHYTINVIYYEYVAPPSAVPMMLIEYEPTCAFVQIMLILNLEVLSVKENIYAEDPL